MWRFKIGDRVRKVGGDYRFPSEIRCRFRKASGAIRYVAEDDRGILHIFSASNLELRLLPKPSKRRRKPNDRQKRRRNRR
jgi:hypothetical protein